MVSPVKILHLQTFKREYIPAERLVGFLSKSPNADRRIGALPYDWIKFVDRENIPDITRQMGDVFERFSKEIDEVTSKEDVKLLTAQQNSIIFDYCSAKITVKSLLTENVPVGS